MLVAVIGATGTAGRPIAAALRGRGAEVRELSRRSAEWPVDLTTGAGLDTALEGCEAVVDASNAGPSPKQARATLVEGGRRLLEAERRAGVGHHVCLSIVGIERTPVPYYGVKVEQEQLVEQSGLSFSIVRATQFHQLIDGLFEAAARFRVLPGGSALLQPVDPADVGDFIAGIATAGPLGGRTAIAGPRAETLGALATTWCDARGRRAAIVPAPLPPRLGRALRGGSLTDSGAQRLGTGGFGEWLSRPLRRRPSPS